MKKYLQVSIPVESNEKRELLIAELISIGFESFEEESNLLKGFISDSILVEGDLRSLIEHHGLQYQLDIIPEKNWNEEWEKNFEPVVIGEFCSVRADFHPSNNKTKYEVIITPKMSFGTGHHATTHMMLELMEKIEFQNQRVFDFGTGTGILAIMAEKLGAKEITALDEDEWSIRNAKENLDRNNCRKITLVQGNNIPADKSFNIILANINRNVILESLQDMCKILEAKGEILLSGLMGIDFEQIHLQSTKLGLRLQKKGEKSGWIALRYVLPS